jgi:ParB-like chromosome segregation protein Spo0J
MELNMPLHRTVMMQVRKLRPNKKNTRTHPKKQIRQVANVILRFGWTYPILVDEDGYIICGHARREAAIELGIKEVPVIVMSGLSDAEKRALALADNKIPANAGWNREILAAELGDLATLLPECNLDLEITGFGFAEFDALVADFSDSEQNPADEPTQLELLPVSRNADFWLFGHHRLLCGDSVRRCR